MRTGLFKATQVKTDYSQRIRLLLRHRQSMVRRNKDLINTVRGTLTRIIHQKSYLALTDVA
jgi:hypothetical protein